MGRLEQVDSGGAVEDSVRGEVQEPVLVIAGGRP